MSQTFAEVVDEVKQLSLAEKEALQELLRKDAIEGRRRGIFENCQTGLKEMKNGKF